MSFNIGEKNSKYVAVSDVTMRYAFSERVLFADLRTSRKTGNAKVNRETGEVVTDKHGNPVPERVYTHWEGRFVGNAFEPAKALRNGQTIDIVNGWMEKEVWKDEGGKRREKVFVVVAEFRMSDADMDEDENPSIDAVGKEIDSVSDAFRALNGDENTPVNKGQR